jgi:hypothetical protein
VPVLERGGLDRGAEIGLESHIELGSTCTATAGGSPDTGLVWLLGVVGVDAGSDGRSHRRQELRDWA